MKRGAKKITDLVLGNKRKAYWKVALLRRIVSDEIMNKHMEINNGKSEDIDFVVNSTEQTGKMF